MPLTQQVNPAQSSATGDINTPSNRDSVIANQTMRRQRQVYSFFVSFLAGFLAVVFLGAAFLTVDCGALLLVTRPDLVFPVTMAGLLSTAGAWSC